MGQFPLMERGDQLPPGSSFGWHCILKRVPSQGAPNVPGDFLNYAKQGARLSCVALQKKEVPINFMQVMSTECKIMGSRGYITDDILEVIDNLANRNSNVTQIITHKFKLDDGAKA